MNKKTIEKRQSYRFKRFARRSYAVFNSMHKTVSIGVIAGCMLAFVHATQSGAQARTSAIRDSIFERELDELIVTASKAELNLNQAAKPVTVITRAEIARQPVTGIPDLLKNIVGLDVRQRGPNGVLSDISVRGGTFDQVAILLNEVNLTNPQTGHYSLDLPVNLSDIERIEIIQGPTSLLYGAGAFSGGVNIVTRKDTAAKLFLKAEAGMYQLGGAEARGTVQTAASSHSLSVGYRFSEGYIPNSDYRLLNIFGQSNFKTGEAKLNIQWGFNDKAYGANTFYSPFYPNQFDDTQSLFASIRGEAGTDLKFIPIIYWNRHYDCFQLYRDGTPNVPDWYREGGHNYHYSDVSGFNLNTRYKWAGGITGFGGEFRNEGIYSNKLGKDTVNRGKYTVRDNRSNISYFLEHTYLSGGFTLGLGILANYNTAYSGDIDFYPNVNLAYRLTGRLRVFASWNNAVRLPTFTDLYYVDPVRTGYPDLQPEKSEAFEAGFKYANVSVLFSASVFQERGKNLIDWVRKSPEDKLLATNLTSVNKTGFEANLSLTPGEWFPFLTDTRLNLGYMYLTQERDANNLISSYVLDYLRHKFIAGLTHPVCKGVSAGWQFRGQKRNGSYSRFAGKAEDGKNILEETPYPAFSLLDLKINWKRKAFTACLTVNNLFNVSYYDLGNIPQPGFWLSAGVSVEL
ncbi:MAG: TonB-dependent receptor [Candidatus Symbiothrix sp.]|jgi:iron complex outermembrane receptor protein|nr:TonB-dependent receptor [Candidatus Symbiothrix sp.]